MSRAQRSFLVVVGGLLLLGCGSDPEYLSIEKLMDPETCKDCHPKHYREWSGSMHAYAADDPVFLAMNQRGQEETGGALGSFCINCHAPLAVALGLTEDGTNLDEVPRWAKGVTCYFCHNVASVEGTHNNPIVLANDGIMRGGLRDAVSPAHETAYSPYVDGTDRRSAETCGSCHDIVTPSGVHIERTYKEWQESLFGDPDPVKSLSCGTCHMLATTDVVAEVDDINVPLRPFGRHEHTFAGIDLALTPWPEMEAQRAAVERDLAAAVLGRVCVVPLAGGRIDYRLDNIAGGHMVPSGAALDRRMWAEVIAFDASDNVLFSSGVIGDGEVVAASPDPYLWQLRDYGFDKDGATAHMFWDVATVMSDLLPPAVTNDRNDPRFDHSVTREYPVPGLLPQIAKVTARVRVRPVGLDVLDDLIGSGHLEASLRDAMSTLEMLGTQVVWTPETADAGGCVNR